MQVKSVNTFALMFQEILQNYELRKLLREMKVPVILFLFTQVFKLCGIKATCLVSPFSCCISMLVKVLSVTLFFSLIMSVLWLQLPCVLVDPFYVLNANFFQDFFQVSLKDKKIKSLNR
jgi:hypothetical protein